MGSSGFLSSVALRWLASSAAPAVIFTKEDSEDLLNRNILRLDVGKYLATRANIVIVLSSFNILNLFGSN